MRYALLTMILLSAMIAPARAADSTAGRDAAHQHYSQGVGLLYSGDAPGALAEFREALRLRPNYANALNNLGAALTELGRGEQALGLFEQARGLEPNDPQVELNAGAAYLQMGRGDEAVAICRRVLERRPDLAAAHLNLGIALADQGSLSEAEACLQTALELLGSGLQVFTAADATGSRFEGDRQLGLQRMSAAGVQIAAAESLAFEWCGTAEHPRFRELSQLVRHRGY